MSVIISYLDEIGETDASDVIDEVGEVGEVDEVDEFDEDEAKSIEDPASSNVGEISVEINIEDLIAEIEAESAPKPVATDKPARKRLEELLEERRATRELADDEEFDLTD